MGRRSPNHLGKNVSNNHRHGSSSPKERPNDKPADVKPVKRDRDYREAPSVSSSQGDCNMTGPSSMKRICPDQSITIEPEPSLNAKEDLSDLFGKEDQDYRVPPSNMNDHRIPYMRSGSHSGWTKFKADHPDEFAPDEKDEPPMDIDERYKDVDMRWNPNQRLSCVENAMKSPYSGRVLDTATRDKHANLLRGAAKLAQSGEISHEEHQLVLKQIGNLQNMNYDKSHKNHDSYQHDQDDNPLGRDFDHRSQGAGRGAVKNYHVLEQGKSMKWLPELPSEDNSHSPHRDPPGNIPHLFVPNHHLQDADMRGHVADMAIPRLPMPGHPAQPGHPHHIHPNEMGWSPAAMMHPTIFDQRWKGNAIVIDGEVSGEVFVDHKPYEIVLNGKPRKIRLHGKIFEIYADARERAIFVNNQIYYRFGEAIKDVQIDGRWHRIHYQGCLKNIWVDQQTYEVRVDAPPRRIILDKEEHSLQIDGRDLMVFIDRVEQGLYGGPPRNILVNNICHEVRFDPPPRQILIDGKPCELKLNCRVPFVVIDGKPHGIRFDGPPREIIIDETPFVVPVDKPIKIRLGKRPHFLAFGGPAHEVIIDGKWFEVRFEGPPVEIHLGNRSHFVMLKGSSPNVKILGELPFVITEPNRPQFGFNNSNMFPPAGPIMDNFNRPRGPENFQPRPPHWDVPFDRRQNLPDPIPILRPSHYPPERPLESIRFPPHHTMPPGMMGSGPVQPLPAPNLVNTGQPPFYPNIAPGLTLPPMTTLPPVLGPVSTDAGPTSAPVGPPQFPQIAFTTAGFVGSVTAPGIPSIPVAPTVLSTANIVSNSVSMPTPAITTVNAPLLPGLTSLPPVLTKMLPNTLLPVSQPPVTNQPIDVASLFQKLVSAGIIPNKVAEKEKEKEKEKEAPPEKVTVPVEKEPEPEVIPDLTDFKTDKLKTKYTKFIKEIYDGIQCSSCGIRFTVDDTEKYREHLDWHFRQNKKEKDDYKVAKYRRWYYEMNEWIQYEEIQDEEEKSRSNFFENMLNPVQEPIGPQGNKVVQCPAATGNDTDDVCDICSDPFEQFWNEDEEEWHLRNAVRVEGKTYHPVCYEDVKENVDTTPVDTPVDEPDDNPLESALEKNSVATSVSLSNTAVTATDSKVGVTSSIPSTTISTILTASVKTESSSVTPSCPIPVPPVEPLLTAVTAAAAATTTTTTTMDSNIMAQPITTIVTSSGLKTLSL